MKSKTAFGAFAVLFLSTVLWSPLPGKNQRPVASETSKAGSGESARLLNRQGFRSTQGPSETRCTRLGAPVGIESEEGNFTHEIRFSRCFDNVTNPSVFKSRISRGGKHTYILTAQARESWRVSIEATTTAAFSIYAPGGAVLKKGQEKKRDSWSGSAPETGDYRVEVISAKGDSDYTLKVSQPSSSASLPSSHNNPGTGSPEYLPNQAPSVTLTASSATITLACRPGKTSRSCRPSASQQVQLTANATDPDGDTLLYNYMTSAGRVMGDGPNAVWDLSGVAPGTYTVTVEVDDGCGCLSLSSSTVRIEECRDCK